jgi:hypothetical protein
MNFGTDNSSIANASSNLASNPVVLQLVVATVAVVVLYVAMGSLEGFQGFIKRLEMARTELLPITYNMTNKTYQISQNPNIQGSKPVNPSNNAMTGTEFSYSFFLMVASGSFKGDKGLTHIFHKGSPQEFPLLGPGVFMASNTNTLYVYMNSYDKFNNCAKVDNIPVGKWVHVAITCESSELLVYINGNIKSRLPFEKTPPYQNYGDIYAFSQRNIVLRGSQIPAIGGSDDTFNIMGCTGGMLSRLYYFNYALSYSEITALMNEGPSSTIDGTQGGMPAPYLRDNWWTADFAT